MDDTRAEVRIDCRGLSVDDVLMRAIPACFRAEVARTRPILRVENLSFLRDSVSRLLKAFERLAESYGALVTLADTSGFGKAFRSAMGPRARLALNVS